MRGASATEGVLARHPDWKIHVLAVWEPILPTDWTAPSGSTLGRMHDGRVQQFWDPTHDVSKALSRIVNSNTSEPQPNSGKGFYWDQAILYGPQAKWGDAPKPLFWQGPVFEVIRGLGTAIASAQQATGPPQTQ